ncbi:MAG: hypothetical protein IPQ02_16260 [Saprospiraceae bacterium]|nr:hypothetical protein [Candidatus Defluviibacterium haderslevense]
MSTKRKRMLQIKIILKKLIIQKLSSILGFTLNKVSINTSHQEINNESIFLNLWPIKQHSRL